MGKKVILSVTNDLVFDQRVAKMCNSLQEIGCEVTLVGRRLPQSPPISRDYKIIRMKLLFERGALFYACFNIRLFWLLLFTKTDIYHSNDLDTLLPNYLVSKIKNKPLIYDTHEYFLGVPEIQNRPLVKKVWTAIERFIFPKLKTVITVNLSISDLYKKDYGKELLVVRNIPTRKEVKHIKRSKDLNMPSDKKIVILQGAGINVDRGAEELLEAIALSQGLILYIVGTGDVLPILKQRATKPDLMDKVKFIGRIPYDEMMQYTFNADVGVTLDKDTNINYRFSLPNKIFDYMKAGIPVLASNLKEVANIVHTYDVGVVINNHSPVTILKGIHEAIAKKELYGANGKKAIETISWDNDIEKVKDVYKNLIN